MNLTIFLCSFCCDFTSHSFCHTEMFPCRLIHQGFLLNVMLKLLSLGCFLACISSLIAAPVLSLSRPLLAWAYCLSLLRIPVPHLPCSHTTTFFDSTPVLRCGSIVSPDIVTHGVCGHRGALSLLDDLPCAVRISSHASSPPLTWSPREGREVKSPVTVRLRVRT